MLNIKLKYYFYVHVREHEKRQILSKKVLSRIYYFSISKKLTSKSLQVQISILKLISTGFLLIVLVFKSSLLNGKKYMFETFCEYKYLKIRIHCSTEDNILTFKYRGNTKNIIIFY